MLSEISQIKTAWAHLYVEYFKPKETRKPQNNKLIDTSRLVVARGGQWGLGIMGEESQKVQTSVTKEIIGMWLHIMVTTVNNTVLYTWELLRE